jgi:hypothetical protein
MSPRHLLDSRGAILLAGFVLATVGLALQESGQLPQLPPITVASPGVTPMSGFGTADSNNAMIAVTGMDITGSSILYLVDTQSRHLAIYQASGGSGSTQGVKLVGARRIDLDMQLDGYNDKSEYSVQELEKKFSEIGHGRPSK